MKIQFIGHRGACAFKPDNTIASFDQAVAEKADMIELDVRQTGDGQLVIYHDWNIAKPCGTSWPVAMTTFAELDAYCASRGFKLATLDEVLRRYLGKIDLNIELKSGGYELEVVRLLEKYDALPGVVISSFLPWVVYTVKAINRRVKTGLIVGQEQVISLNRLAGPLVEFLYQLIKPEFLYLHFMLITLGLVKRFKQRNVPVYAWTVDDAGVARSLISMGVAGIITNIPGRLRHLLDCSSQPETYDDRAESFFSQGILSTLSYTRITSQSAIGDGHYLQQSPPDAHA